MTTTKAYIVELRNNFVNITLSQEKKILDRFGVEPDDHYEWSEQDIHEQIRKIIRT